MGSRGRNEGMGKGKEENRECMGYKRKEGSIYTVKAGGKQGPGGYTRGRDERSVAPKNLYCNTACLAH